MNVYRNRSRSCSYLGREPKAEHRANTKKSCQLLVVVPNKRETSVPSIFQAIKTMLGFDDHELEVVLLHPQSDSKAPPTKKKRRESSTPESPKPESHDGWETKKGKDAQRTVAKIILLLHFGRGIVPSM